MVAMPVSAGTSPVAAMNCEAQLPHLRAMCRHLLDHLGEGQPRPSHELATLPALGTPEAKQLGYACVGRSSDAKAAEWLGTGPGEQDPLAAVQDAVNQPEQQS